LPKEGQVYEKLSRDLDGDGKPETIGLVAYRIQKESDSHWGRLTVWGPGQKLLWQSPPCKEARQPMAFGVWPFGSSRLQWLGSIGGQMQLISAEAQSDLRPPNYRRYRWNGKAFEWFATQQLIQSSAGVFEWTKQEWDGNRPITWINDFKGSQQVEVVRAGPGQSSLWVKGRITEKGIVTGK
jgi:hypothetical protein